MGFLCHVLQCVTAQGRQALGQVLCSQLGLRHQPATTRGHQELRIGGLVVVNSKWEWHEQGGHAHCGQLGHGAGACTTDHQIGLRKGAGRVIDERGQFGLHTCVRVVGPQRVNLLGAALVNDLRAYGLWHQGQSLGHDVVQCLGSQASAHHQHTQRATASGKAFSGRGLFSESAAQGVTHPLTCFEDARECGEHPIGQLRQHLVGQSRHRVLLVQNQRLAPQAGHHAARESDVTAQPQHHVGLNAAHHLQALPESPQQLEWQECQCGQPLAAHTPKGHRLKGKTARRHQLAFHAVRRAQPVHAPARLTQSIGHSQARENVSPSAARHDKCTFLCHARPPRIICLFSASMRSTTAMAIRFIMMAEPP